MWWGSVTSPSRGSLRREARWSPALIEASGSAGAAGVHVAFWWSNVCYCIAADALLPYRFACLPTKEILRWQYLNNEWAVFAPIPAGPLMIVSMHPRAACARSAARSSCRIACARTAATIRIARSSRPSRAVRTTKKEPSGYREAFLYMERGDTWQIR